jgi:hypothetical protein
MEGAVHYRCYFLNSHSNIERVEISDAENDADAVARGSAVFREKGVGFRAFELWDCGRLIHRHDKSDPL